MGTQQRATTIAIIVAALGYFVDVYDLILFGMVRSVSLRELGVSDLKADGILLLNMQMGGMLVGGILWGVLGDKRGRLSVLFGSIALYSLANIANGMVDSLPQYAACRLFAGIGLAGELGAGITLVSELVDRRTRGIATTLVAALGLGGGIVAGLVGGAVPGIGVHWRTAYYIGGGMGLALLALRVGVVESGMFARVTQQVVSRGNFFSLFTQRDRLRKYLAIILVGVPTWYVVGILFTLSPELGKALGLPRPPNAATALMLLYIGLTVGDIGWGLLSHVLGSRRRALAICLTSTSLMIVAYFVFAGRSVTTFYVVCVVAGLAVGYWAIFVSTAAELFGTNLRATVATTVPNFVRGSLVLVTMGLQALEPLGIIPAAAIMGGVCIGLAVLGLASLPETYAVDLDYHD